MNRPFGRTIALVSLAALAACSRAEPTPAPAVNVAPKTTTDPVPKDASNPALPAGIPPDVRAAAQLAERTAVAGVEGFRVFSRVEFDADPDQVQLLQATYSLPDRAHWRMTPIDEGLTPNRLIEYRLGALAFQLKPFEASSSEVEGESRDVLHRRMELRRALMLWPDGFDWTEEPHEGTEGPTTLARAPLTRADGLDFGAVEAELAEDGRPRQMWVVDPAGLARERFVLDGWQERHGRTWPQRVRLLLAAQPVWTETILDVQPGSHYLDLFFLPPDRRQLRTGRDQTERALDLIGQTFFAVDVRASNWEGALEEADLAMEAAAEQYPELELDWVPTFELHDDGRPRRILVRLERPLAPPPEGWVTLGDRPGVLTMVATPAELTPGRLAALTRSVPAGAAPGTPYVRLYDDAHGARIQLLLPFQPPE